MARKAQSPLGPLALALVAILLATLALWQTVAAGDADMMGQATSHTVERYDSLVSVAAKYGVSASALAAANGLEPHAILYRNQVLAIPASDMDTGMMDAAVDTAAEAPMASAAMTETEQPDMGADMATPEPTEAAMSESMADETMAADESMAAGPKTYKVERYDSLRAIARKFHVSVQDLATANGLEVNDILYRNQVLIIPSTDSATMALPIPAMTTEATPAPTEEATTEPTEEPVEEMTAEATAEATEVPTEEGAEMMTPEATEEPMAEATAEATEEPVEEPMAEPTEEATEEPAAEVTTEAMEEPTEEPTEAAVEEPAEEMTPEATAEPTEEPTEEPMAEATAEPTEEPAEEPMAEPTEEPTEEPVAEEEMMDPDVIAAAEAAGDFTTLLAAIDAAGLTEVLQSEGPFTVLAPTDAAFAALPAGLLDELMADPAGDLTQILLYHVLPGKVTTDEIEDGQIFITLQGGEVTFSVQGDVATANDANLSITNIETGNGVIHVLDAVLIPPDLAAAPPDVATANSPNAAPNQAPPTGTIARMNEEMTVADAAVIVIAPPTAAGNTIVGATAPWQDATETLRIITPVSTTVDPAANPAVAHDTSTPSAGFPAAYHSPIAVSGLARAATGNVHISLITDDETILAERTLALGDVVTPDEADPNTFAFFAGSLRFYVNEVTEATLRVVEMDMGDGTILAEVRVPITLLGGQRVIDVTTPVVAQAVCEEIIVSGYSNTFEANVVVSLLTPAGSIQAELPTMGGNLGVYRDFAAVITYPVDAPTALLVAVTETDASGRFDSIDRTLVPVTVYPADAPECSS